MPIEGRYVPHNRQLPGNVAERTHQATVGRFGHNRTKKDSIHNRIPQQLLMQHYTKLLNIIIFVMPQIKLFGHLSISKLIQNE